MVSPVHPGGQMPIIPTNTFVGQKMERGQEELPRLVVDKKENVTSAREEVPREEVEKTVEKLNRLMGLIEKKLKFEVHEKSHRIMVTIIDEKSGEVLREVPPKKVLDMLSSFTEYIGLLVDKKV